jgi:uncharacterized protein
VKLHLAGAAGNNLFTGHGERYVAVNNQRYERTVVVTADALHQPWEIERFEELKAEHFKFLLTLEPEIVILGTGTKQRFPHPELLRDLTAARIGVEVMDTAAACRTYNILMTEGRKVVAAVLVA